MAFDLGDYVDVKTRLALFYKQYPTGSIASTYDLVSVAGAPCWVVSAVAYREPGDPSPGVGLAQQPIPGTTPYTRGSELENAQTSAWGRAIGSFGIGTEAGVATWEEVRRAQPDERVKVEAPLPPGLNGPAAARESSRRSDPGEKQTPQQKRLLYGFSKGIRDADGDPGAVIMEATGLTDGYDLEALTYGQSEDAIAALKAAKTRLAGGIKRTKGAPAGSDAWETPLVDPMTGEVAE